MDEPRQIVAHHRGVEIIATKAEGGWQAKGAGIGALSDTHPSSHEAIAEIKQYLDEATPAAAKDAPPSGRYSGAGVTFELPPPDTTRWVIRRKAIVVAAVRSGLLSIQEACQRYQLSLDEFLGWQRALDRHGVPGLRVTQLQIYRDNDDARTADRHRPRSSRTSGSGS